LILCRNVFIYFTSETQKRLTARFVQSLKPGGYFIVGSAEQIVDPARFPARQGELLHLPEEVVGGENMSRSVVGEGKTIDDAYQ